MISMMNSGMTQRLTRLTPLTAALARLDELARPVAPRDIELAAAAGRVLAADATAATPVPATAIALRDGWAVQSDVVHDAGSYAPVPLVPAPDWVEVGAPVPQAADAVIVADAVTMRGDVAEALAPAVAGEGVLAAGGDAPTGRLLRRAGQRLREIDLAVLRAAGVARVAVREAHVRVVCANHLIDYASDTVGPLLARAIEMEGGVAEVEWVESDGERELARVLADPTADAVITIGGTGCGRGDDAVVTLGRVGRVEIHGVGLAPGETAALGTVASRPMLMLPGRLDAALAAWLVLGRRLMARLTGHSGEDSAQMMTVARKIVGTVGMADMVLVRRCAGGLESVAAGPFPLHAMAGADGFVLVPAESEGFPEGATVEMRPIP
jgi:molybdopterin molybdotransferase